MNNRLFLLALLPAAFATPDVAASTADKAARDAAKTDARVDPRLLENALALRGHPDLEYRGYGMDAYRREDYERALVLFRRAARFGDKPSQGVIAEMYASGRGVARDPVLAYVWMDLAAERGYRDFIRHRERYWERLDEASRARAVEVGQALYAEYGDDVAKPRFAAQLKRESKLIVGSRTGFASNVKVTIPSIFGDQSFDAAQMGRDFWNADAYWKLQDRLWKNPGGRVTTSDLQDVRKAEPANAKDAPPGG